jgi:hypothetical protein
MESSWYYIWNTMLMIYKHVVISINFQDLIFVKKEVKV